MNERKFTIHTDGGARGNPGPGGIGVVIEEGAETVAAFGEFIGHVTNNQAEYRAVIRALEKAKELGATHVEVFVDSQLIARQISREYKIKEKTLAQLAMQAWNLTQGFQSFSITEIPREKNKAADTLVNEAIDRRGLTS